MSHNGSQKRRRRYRHDKELISIRFLTFVARRTRGKTEAQSTICPSRTIDRRSPLYDLSRAPAEVQLAVVLHCKFGAEQSGGHEPAIR